MYFEIGCIMAKKEDEVEQEPLTEKQRITALEVKVGGNKIILLSIAIFLIIAVSVTSTFFVVSIFAEDETVDDSEMVITLQEKVSELEKILEELKKATKTSRSELSLLKEKVSNSSNLKLQQIILEQEQANQTFLETLRSGMYDLAHMLPGSRTWLEVYGEKVDKATIYSKDREKALLSLQKGVVKEAAIQEDPFSEGF
ncbi:MAG: phage-related protein [Oleiphilaceae bacterium]|jgi:phage-related protein